MRRWVLSLSRGMQKVFLWEVAGGPLGRGVRSLSLGRDWWEVVLSPRASASFPSLFCLILVTNSPASASGRMWS